MLQLIHCNFNTNSRLISLHTNRLVKASVQTAVATAKTDPLRWTLYVLPAPADKEKKGTNLAKQERK